MNIWRGEEQADDVARDRKRYLATGEALLPS